MMRALRKEERRYTYADYCTWDDGERWELIDGIAYAMAPAPSDGHQSVSGEILFQLSGFLRGKPCKVRSAPYDVRLNADGEDDTVVQPDIVVICDSNKITKTGCVGAPDLVIEILSPSTAKHDTHTKFITYKRAGVREYWIVNPETGIVATHILANGEYISHPYGETDTVPVHVLEGCYISMREVFADIAELAEPAESAELTEPVESV